MSRLLGHCQDPETGRIAASFAGSSLLELSVAVGLAQTPCVALVDSGVSHCFIAEHVAHAAGVCWDVRVCLGVRLADGELRPCLGFAGVVHVQFLPGVWQPVDCWVVPLAMDFILGQPWLRAVEPAINWGIQRVLWE